MRDRIASILHAHRTNTISQGRWLCCCLDRVTGQGYCNNGPSWEDHVAEAIATELEHILYVRSDMRLALGVPA